MACSRQMCQHDALVANSKRGTYSETTPLHEHGSLVILLLASRRRVSRGTSADVTFAFYVGTRLRVCGWGVTNG